MNRFRTQARSGLALVVVASIAVLSARGQSAEEIMRATRLNPLNQQAELDARLRIESTGTRVPFTISVRDGVVSYRFTNPDQEIQLTLGEDGSDLTEKSGGKTVAVKPSRPVRGSTVTYEDLALKLLYWPNPKIVGEETIRSLKCWKIEVHPPRGQSQYSAARIWISQTNGGVLRIEAYGADGRVVKSFEALSVRKINDKWMLKTMRVDSYDPQTHKALDSARTYLEVLGEAKSRE